MSRTLLLVGGRVVDPGQGLDAARDVRIEKGVVTELGRRLSPGGATVVDVAGLVVCPGFVDLRARLREPGDEEKETVATGTRAAAAGGFAAVCAMPGTRPVNDDADATRALLERAQRAAAARVYPVGALSQGCRGEDLAEYGDLRDAGCVAVDDDERAPVGPRLMRRALEYARAFDLPVVGGGQDPELAAGAAMNEGPVATRLGLPGAPGAAEAIVAARDLALAELTGGRLHLARVSTAGVLEALRRARARGARVTAEVAAHHLVLTDEAVAALPYDTAARLDPPLRSEADRRALLKGLRDGTLDCVVSDHAPHTVDEKDLEFDAASPGASSLETAVAVCLDLVSRDALDLGRLVELLSSGPARAFGLPGGSLAKGSPGDVTVLDPGLRREVDPGRFLSKGRSSPLAGRTLTGWPVLTVVGGRVVFDGRR